ncbi:GerAB/ArcD/ProY family transporter [Paenibacillus sp. UNC451MF]|uniref:GerAB/ArcD/ProY family transporter n=1 Tax=Paenibacillus sp. UNC451MF TaxID=1449063 RepID=UPI00048B88D9|nr:endospore germination permease [Paenibacillus sp. UNC451MF]
MSVFKYADDEIGQKEMIMTVASMLIGVGVLTLPRLVAHETSSSDGWISILLAGAVTLLFGIIVSKLGSRFNQKSFFEYTSIIASKPVAYVLTFLQSIYFFLFCAYEMRAIASISKQYLFDRTPIEFVALSFLLVIIYAVSGSSVGLIRLNVMFLPLVLSIALLMLALSIGIFEFSNLKPFFITPPLGILKGSEQAMYSMLGFEIVLFYISLMRRPKETTKAMVYGIAIPVIFYLIIFIFGIGIFSHAGTVNIMFPAIEIAKEIEIPGEFFERFESVFFVIWMMTIFNTTSMAMDVSRICLTSVFKKMSKRTCILILSPLVYLLGMFPKDQVEFAMLGNIISYSGVLFAAVVPTMLLIVAKVRGVTENG